MAFLIVFLTSLLINTKGVLGDCFIKSNNVLEMDTCTVKPTGYLCKEGDHIAKVVKKAGEHLQFLELNNRVYQTGKSATMTCLKGGVFDGIIKFVKICYEDAVSPNEVATSVDTEDGCKYVQEKLTIYTSNEVIKTLSKRCKMTPPDNGVLLDTRASTKISNQVFDTETNYIVTDRIEGNGPFLTKCKNGYHAKDDKLMRVNSKVSNCVDGKIDEVLICVEIHVVSMKGNKEEPEWYIKKITYELYGVSICLSGISAGSVLFGWLIVKRRHGG